MFKLLFRCIIYQKLTHVISTCTKFCAKLDCTAADQESVSRERSVSGGCRCKSGPRCGLKSHGLMAVMHLSIHMKGVCHIKSFKLQQRLRKILITYKGTGLARPHPGPRAQVHSVNRGFLTWIHSVQLGSNTESNRVAGAEQRGRSVPYMLCFHAYEGPRSATDTDGGWGFWKKSEDTGACNGRWQTRQW